MTPGALLDELLDTFGGALGFTLRGRPIDLRRAVELANEVRGRAGAPPLVYLEPPPQPCTRDSAPTPLHAAGAAAAPQRALL